MKKNGSALIAAATLFVALACPASAAGRQYAIIQEKRIDTGPVAFRRESSANLVQIKDVSAWNLNSDFAPLAAAFITDLPQSRQCSRITFNCRKQGRGIIFKDTAEPIVRCEFSSKKNPNVRLFSTIPHKDVYNVEGNSDGRSVQLKLVDGEYPIIHKIGIVARHDSRGTFIKDHADMTVWGLSTGLSSANDVPVRVDVFETGVRHDNGPNYDKFINEAFHID
jgi:hypothetical protein